MFFSRESLYGWGVCKVPMPRSTTDIFTDRRRRAANIDFPDRREEERSPGILACVGSICRQDVPWREVVLIVALAFLFLAGLAVIAALLPRDIRQPEPLPIDIVVALKKDPPPAMITEVSLPAAPASPIEEATPQQEVSLPVAPAQKTPSVSVVKTFPVEKRQPKKPVKVAEKAPEKRRVNPILNPPKQELVMTPPVIARQGYRTAEEPLETAPKKQALLQRSHSAEALSVKTSMRKSYADKSSQVESLPVESRLPTPLAQTSQVALPTAGIKKRPSVERTSSESLDLAQAAPRLAQASVTVETSRSAFPSYAKDSRPQQEAMLTKKRVSVVTAKETPVTLGQAAAEQRIYEKRDNRPDSLQVSGEPTAFATQKDVKLAGAGHLKPKRELPKMSVDQSLPSATRIFQSEATGQETAVTAAVALGQDRAATRSADPTTSIAGAAPSLDRDNLATIDPSLFRSLQQMKINACLDPGEEGRLRTRLATLLQDAGRCSDGQLAYNVKYPQDGYSVHLTLYNPGGLPITDRCMALNRAIECFDNAKR